MENITWDKFRNLTNRIICVRSGDNTYLGLMRKVSQRDVFTYELDCEWYMDMSNYSQLNPRHPIASVDVDDRNFPGEDELGGIIIRTGVAVITIYPPGFCPFKQEVFSPLKKEEAVVRVKAA